MAGFSNAILQNKDASKKIQLKFNPSSYEISSRVNYKKSNGKTNTKEEALNYAGVESILSLKLEFAEEEDGDVSEQIEKLEEFLKLPETGEPVEAFFIWGSLKFNGYVKNLKSSYTRFTKEGKPIRATVQLEMKEKKTETKRFQSSGGTKNSQVSEGTSVWGIAYQEFGDESRWRQIAESNGILNPLEIPTGTMLKV